jgi:parallel beta-helix repeat protein
VLDSGWLGILLCGGSSENNITRNTLKDNANGLGLTGTNNTIYHNNFIANQNQTRMDSSHINIWDNSYEGNYWSDYNGTDFDRYGIGSIPYTIDADNQDNCPLKSPHMIGDINHDAKVNILDIMIIARAFWTVPGDGRWNIHADIDGNNEINIADISIPAKSFRKEWKDP